MSNTNPISFAAPFPVTTPEEGRANTKIIVVVHGVGDQIGYASAQSVAYQFCRYCEQPAAIPLGRFHTEFADDGKRSVPRPIFIRPPPSGPKLPNLAFAEVYWADIPRTVVKEGYVLEEAKRWARTIVGRYRLLRSKPPPNEVSKEDSKEPSEKEVTRLETVLEAMIETIFVLEGLTTLGGSSSTNCGSCSKTIWATSSSWPISRRIAKRSCGSSTR